jgi:hypothetical protein
VASTSEAICATSASSDANALSSRSRSQSSTTSRCPYRSPSKSRRYGSIRRPCLRSAGFVPIEIAAWPRAWPA